MRTPKTARIRVQLTPSPEFVQWKGRLDELLDDKEALNRLVRYALTQTVLKAVRERFIRGLPEALHVHVSNKDPKPARASKDLERSLSNALQSLSEASVNGDKGAIDKAERRVARLQKSYEVALKGDRHKRRTSKRPSTYAVLVERAMQVLNLLAGPEALANLGQGQVAMGNLTKLEGIKTPTANRKGTTKSRMTTLWKQLEFGTGIYALDKSVNSGSKFKQRGGGGEWWWGPRAGQGVLIAGSMPLHSLRLGDEFYGSTEMKQLEQTLRALLAQALAL